MKYQDNMRDRRTRAIGLSRIDWTARTGILLLTIAFLAFPGATVAIAEQGLRNCADQFPGGDIGNAPALPGAEPGQPGDGNIHICKRWGDTSFFAIEYDETKYAAIWAAYRIGDVLGESACASMKRREMQCYFSQDDVDACIADKDINASDPFHAEPLLKDLGFGRIGIGTFFGTGHDRGHLAPNNAFSWHACGAYKTFTMANMAAQWSSHNQEIWSRLEAQVLYWSVTERPVYVVTGPVWTTFPSDRFDAIRTGLVDVDQFSGEDEVLTKKDGTVVDGEIPVPTGFYKVIYRSGEGAEPDRAVAFLVPHTREKGLPFWYFVSTVDLVEEVSGLTFGFDDNLKAGAGQTYWLADERRAKSGWDMRRGCGDRPPVAGWRPDLSRKERRAVCARSTED